MMYAPKRVFVTIGHATLLGLIVLAGIITALGGAKPERAEAMPPGKNMTDLKIQKEESSVLISVVADGSILEYKSFALSDPTRLVIDLVGFKSSYPHQTVPVNHTLLERIRIGISADKVRLVLDIPQARIPPYETTKEADTLLITLGKPLAEVAKKEPELAKEPPSVPVEKESKKVPEKPAPAATASKQIKEEPRLTPLPPPAKEVKKIPEKPAPVPTTKRQIETKPRVAPPSSPPPAKEVKEIPEKSRTQVSTATKPMEKESRLAPASPPVAREKTKEIPEKKQVVAKIETKPPMQPAAIETLTGKQIAQKVYDRNDGDDSYARA